MFYSEVAQVLTTESASDGMGGWIDSDIPVKLAEMNVRRAPVSSEVMLKQYGLVTTTAMKLYTEDKLPKGDNYIHYQGGDYRILQISEYDVETILLLELM